MLNEVAGLHVRRCEKLQYKMMGSRWVSFTEPPAETSKSDIKWLSTQLHLRIHVRAYVLSLSQKLSPASSNVPLVSVYDSQIA
jgi:hypothetical protein